MSGEMVEFAMAPIGMVQNLNPSDVGIIIFGRSTRICEGLSPPSRKSWKSQ